MHTEASKDYYSKTPVLRKIARLTLELGDSAPPQVTVSKSSTMIFKCMVNWEKPSKLLNITFTGILYSSTDEQALLSDL